MQSEEGMTNDCAALVRNSDFVLHSSLRVGHSVHPQLRKQKSVNIGQLFDTFAQCRADAVPRAGTGS